MYSYRQKPKQKRHVSWDVVGASVLNTEERKISHTLNEKTNLGLNLAIDPNPIGKIQKEEKKFDPENSLLMKAVFKDGKRTDMCVCEKCGKKKKKSQEKKLENN